jgi:hypothetical protein
MALFLSLLVCFSLLLDTPSGFRFHSHIVPITKLIEPKRRREVSLKAARPTAPVDCEVFDQTFDEISLSRMKSTLLRSLTSDPEETLVIDREALVSSDGNKVPRKLSALESGIVSFLDAMGDSSRYVEWWWRDEVNF